MVNVDTFEGPIPVPVDTNMNKKIQDPLLYPKPKTPINQSGIKEEVSE